mmetsp:Transcript_6558/g.13832  ORF Transcript_6558/g.13832 Transcript_6558/m.13832 type:complete len:81 (+) Transcript_6558:717-959(+)
MKSQMRMLRGNPPFRYLCLHIFFLFLPKTKKYELPDRTSEGSSSTRRRIYVRVRHVAVAVVGRTFCHCTMIKRKGLAEER